MVGEPRSSFGGSAALSALYYRIMELWPNIKLAGTIVLIVAWVALAFYLRWLSI